MNNLKESRNSSIETLRIVAMLFIVLSHCVVHAGFPTTQSSLAFNNLLLDWCVLGNLGVDIFILITGYFLSSKQNFNRKDKAVRLLSQVWFFSIISLLIYIITGHKITGGIVVTAIFPTIFSEYWFFTIYFVLLLVVPYINMVLDKLSRAQLFSVIAMMLLIWSIIPTFTRQSMGSSKLAQFIMLYFIGAYLKKYPDNILSVKKRRILLTILSFLLLFSSSSVLMFVFPDYTNCFYTMESVLIVGCAVGLFSVAAYGKKYYNKWINRIASCTFGIYLLHDNPYFRTIIWTEWLPKTQFYNSYFLIVAIALSVIIVMIGSIAVECIRKLTVEKFSVNLLNRIVERIQILIKNIGKKYFKIL